MKKYNNHGKQIAKIYFKKPSKIKKETQKYPGISSEFPSTPSEFPNCFVSRFKQPITAWFSVGYRVYKERAGECVQLETKEQFPETVCIA